jgi:hypothetical protein
VGSLESAAKGLSSFGRRRLGVADLIDYQKNGSDGSTLRDVSNLCVVRHGPILHGALDNSCPIYFPDDILSLHVLGGGLSCVLGDILCPGLF